jgi:hypothetical protein
MQNMLHKQESEIGVSDYLRDEFDLPTLLDTQAALHNIEVLENFANNDAHSTKSRKRALLEAKKLADKIKRYYNYH